MFELLLLAIFCWLFFWAVGITFRVAWGVAKVVAILLFILAVPAFIGVFLIAGGALLLLPLAPLIIALVLLKKAS